MVSQVSDDIATSLGRRIQPTFGYYRQPNGWITISPSTGSERVKYTEEGWKHLNQYGAFDMTPYVANHPFEGLCMFGGASEIPVEQLLQTGLYLNPPLVPRCREHITQFHRSHTKGCWIGAVPATFPQMATVPEALIGPFLCGFCSRKDLPTTEARKQHQSVAHVEELGRLQTGQTMGESLAAALSHTASPVASPELAEMQRTIDKLKAQVEKQEQAKAARARAKRRGVPVGVK